MVYSKQQLFPVGGAEAALVQRHAEMMARYIRETDKDDGLIRPIIFFENKADSELHRQYCNLAVQKQKEYGLEATPKLIPIMPQPVCQPAPPYQQRPFFYECRHSEPTDLELARLYIHRQHVRTRNGSVYLYNGKNAYRLNSAHYQI